MTLSWGEAAMAAVDLALRSAALALLVFVAALLLRDAPASRSGRYAALYCFGVAAYLVVSSPALAFPHPLWLLPLHILAAGNVAVFWVLAASLFDDDFAPSWRHGLAWLALVALNLWCIYGQVPLGHLAFAALAVLVLAAALREALAGRAGDLVEGRRRIRLVFVVAVGVYAAADILGELALPGAAAQQALAVANSLGIVAITVIFAGSFIAVTRQGMLAPALPAPLPPPVAIVTSADPQEAALLGALGRLMEEDRVYREEGLSVAVLAGRLGVPEYRLRRAINQRLGHRNFSAFLNGYRLGDALAALADPGQAEVPILTIALDAGFQSLGPFNRAFKAQTGLTPSEYRRQRLAAAARTAAA